MSRRYLLLGLALYVALLAVIHTVLGGTIHIVWTGIGFATFLLAVAALVTAGVKVKEYMDRTDELEVKVNGGLADAARTHLQDNELFESLIVRVDRAEAELAEVLTAKEECSEALSELRGWVVTRLDETGNGRSEPR